MRFDSAEVHQRIKAKLMKNAIAEAGRKHQIPAHNDQLDEMVFRLLQAVSDDGVSAEQPMWTASAIAEHLLEGGPAGEPAWEVKKTRLFDRIVRSINRLTYQHRVLKPDGGGKWRLSNGI